MRDPHVRMHAGSLFEQNNRYICVCMELRADSTGSKNVKMILRKWHCKATQRCLPTWQFSAPVRCRLDLSSLQDRDFAVQNKIPTCTHGAAAAGLYISLLTASEFRPRIVYRHTTHFGLTLLASIVTRTKLKCEGCLTTGCRNGTLTSSWTNSLGFTQIDARHIGHHPLLPEPSILPSCFN